MLWLWKRSGMQLFYYAAPVLGVLGATSLIFNWGVHYIDGSMMPVIVNKVYLTGLGCLGFLAAGFALLFRNENKADLTPAMRSLRQSLLTFGGVLLYLVHLFELVFQYHHRITDMQTQGVMLVGFHLLLMVGFSVYARVKNYYNALDLTVLGSLLAIVVMYLMHGGMHVPLRNGMLEGISVASLGFALHYLNLVLVLIMIGISASHLPQLKAKLPGIAPVFHWGIAGTLVFLLSTELDHLTLWFFHGKASTLHILAQTHKIGFPILWGLTAFTLMLFGLKRRIKSLRIIGLVLLGITLLKLFIFDLRGISEPGKIAAFMALGVLLLTISFMYQKLKTFLLEDDTAATADQLPSEIQGE